MREGNAMRYNTDMLKTSTINFRVSSELREEIAAAAAAKGRRPSDWLRMAIVAALHRQSPRSRRKGGIG